MTRFSKFFLVMTAVSLGACSHYSDDLSSLDGSMKANPTALAYNTTATSPQDIQPAAGGGLAAPGPACHGLHGHGRQPTLVEQGACGVQDRGPDRGVTRPARFARRFEGHWLLDATSYETLRNVMQCNAQGCDG